jgi:hypothetical protein
VFELGGHAQHRAAVVARGRAFAAVQRRGVVAAEGDLPALLREVRVIHRGGRVDDQAARFEQALHGREVALHEGVRVDGHPASRRTHCARPRSHGRSRPSARPRGARHVGNCSRLVSFASVSLRSYCTRETSGVFSTMCVSTAGVFAQADVQRGRAGDQAHLFQVRAREARMRMQPSLSNGEALNAPIGPSVPSVGSMPERCRSLRT